MLIAATVTGLAWVGAQTAVRGVDGRAEEIPKSAPRP